MINDNSWIDDYSYKPRELTEQELWYMTDDEITVFKKDYKKYRASVKAIREIRQSGGQFNLIFE